MAPDSRNETTLNFGAAVLGWFLPGLGQIVIGEKRRGILAMIGILGLFITGVFIGGIDCVDKDEDRLWFAGQVVTGPIAVGTAYANEILLKSGKATELVPTPPSMAEMMRGITPKPIPAAKGLAHANEFGTLLCFLAGLINLVVIMDALVRSEGQCPYERRGPGSATSGGGR
jgi:TM2 domain-containing membrane protein YozV